MKQAVQFFIAFALIVMLAPASWAAQNSNPDDGDGGGTATPGGGPGTGTGWYPTTPTTPNPGSNPKTPPGIPGTCSECDAYPGTTIGPDGISCICPRDTKWDGTSCVPHTYTNADCPSSHPTYNPITGNCEKQYQIPVPGPFPDALPCEVTENTRAQATKSYICLDNWTPYDSAVAHTFNGSTNYVNVSALAPPNLKQKKAAITSICDENNQLVPALHRDTPDYKNIGFCKLDQCYFWQDSKTTLKEACLSPGEWVLDNSCTLSEDLTTAHWTSRTQYVAESLYTRAQELGLNNFILHCDADTDSLNNYTNTTGYSKYSKTGKPSPFINSFCVLSQPSGSGIRTLAIGTSLNTESGYQDDTVAVDRFDYSGTPDYFQFVRVLNYSLLSTDDTTCDDVKYDFDGEFHPCAISANGSVWYNAQHDLLLASTDAGFTMDNTWIDTLRAAWNDIFGNPAPNPLIELSGRKIYVYKQGSRLVQATMQPSPDGGTLSTVVYQGIADQTVQKIVTGTRAQYSTVPNVGIVIRLSNATQSDWEQLTLSVRPQ